MRFITVLKLLLLSIIVVVLLLLPLLHPHRQCYACWKWQFDFLISVEFEYCHQLHCAQLAIDNW